MDKSIGFQDNSGRTWHTLERDDGSIVVYYTRPGYNAHFVVYDELDLSERKPLVNAPIGNDNDA